MSDGWGVSAQVAVRRHVGQPAQHRNRLRAFRAAGNGHGTDDQGLGGPDHARQWGELGQPWRTEPLDVKVPRPGLAAAGHTHRDRGVFLEARNQVRNQPFLDGERPAQLAQRAIALRTDQMATNPVDQGNRGSVAAHTSEPDPDPGGVLGTIGRATRNHGQVQRSTRDVHQTPVSGAWRGSMERLLDQPIEMRSRRHGTNPPRSMVRVSLGKGFVLGPGPPLSCSPHKRIRRGPRVFLRSIWEEKKRTLVRITWKLPLRAKWFEQGFALATRGAAGPGGGDSDG